MLGFIKARRGIFVTTLLWIPVSLSIVFLTSKIQGSGYWDSALFVIPLLILELFILISLKYLCKAVKIEKVFFIKNLIIHLLTAFLLNIIWLVIIIFYAQLLDEMFAATRWTQFVNRALPVMIASGITLYFISILVHYLVLSGKRRKAAEQEVYQQQISKIKAELKALKATVHPHFLFNSLAMIRPLIKKDPPLAQSIVMKLGDFLLRSIRYSKKEYASLREEVDHIKNYLAIEKLRLGDRLKCKYDIDERLLDHEVMSLLLLPLVENAIKHGIEQCLREGVLTLTIRGLANGGISVEVTNPYDELSPGRNGERMGLATLQKRLDSHHGSRAALEITRSDKIFQARIVILFKKD